MVARIPDPITSLTWDNAALLSVSTIKELAKKGSKLENDDLVVEDKAHLIQVDMKIVFLIFQFCLLLVMPRIQSVYR